jgi:methyl-accepting chemotaxis protein
MSIFQGISGFFGSSRLADSKKAQILEEINLMDAINAHVKWKTRLQNYLNGNSQEQLDPMVICRDDQCVLGKWIHGPAMKHFHEDSTFHELRADHAQFHFIAGSVVKHVQSNERPQAEALMDNEYKHASRKVVQALTDLNTHLNGQA